ncbi:hypothetical protein TNCV_1487761 [Trichonephila clavipes]|nr:hypothetical protein TNCV_1487761 [Trichonephila clavipes]
MGICDPYWKELETDQAIEEPTEIMHINQDSERGTIKIMIENWIASSESLKPLPLSDKSGPAMLRNQKMGKFAKCRKALLSLEADFDDESARKVNSRRISVRGNRFSNRFPKISETLTGTAIQL